MRVASNQFQSILISSLQANQTGSSRVNQQMSSTKRLLVPSDDPIASVRISRLTREQSTINQYLDNIAAIRIRLQSSESYMSGMVGEVNEARDIFVGALDASNTPADLNAKATPLKTLRDSLFYTSNTKDQEGRSVFSGTLTNTDAITYNGAAAVGARYTYTGNTEKQLVLVGTGITQPANSDVGGVETFLNQLDAAIAALESPTASITDPVLRAALTTALNGADAGIELISSKIANFGGAQNIMKTLADNHGNVGLSNEIALGELGDLDYAAAATELEGYTFALKATYQAYSTISKLTLLDAL